MGWLIFGSSLFKSAQSRFDEVNGWLDEALHLPLPGNITTTYAAPIAHPDGKQLAMYIEESVLPFLTDEQKASIVSAEELRNRGWFLPLP